MVMHDFRGNKYPEEKLTELCEDCKKEQAVRNCCIAEGDLFRTHWHGAIHTHDHKLKFLCRNCAEIEHKKFKN